MDNIKSIQPETPEMEAFLQAGYPDMTVERANEIIEARKKNPAVYPYAEMQRAQAFLDAYKTRPTVAATAKQPPKRKRGL